MRISPTDRWNTMETGFCLAALETAVGFRQPEIWNSDQGARYTATDFLAPLKRRGIAISMDGRGRALDNVFIDRLWRSLKYANGLDLFAALEKYFHFTIINLRTRRTHTGRSPVIFDRAFSTGT